MQDSLHKSYVKLEDFKELSESVKRLNVNNEDSHELYTRQIRDCKDKLQLMTKKMMDIEKKGIVPTQN